MRWWGAVALLVAFTVTVLGQERLCTQAVLQRADMAVDTLNSWDRIYDWYKKLRNCDQGAPAEGVSEAVARNLVDRWETLPRLGELAKNVGFRHFVLKHLDATLNADDLKKISTNATERCPTNLHSLCHGLRVRADAP